MKKKFKDNAINVRFSNCINHLLKTGKCCSEIATTIGVFPQAIRNTMYGDRQPTMNMIQQLVKAYKFDANYFFGKSESMFFTRTYPFERKGRKIL